MPGRYRAVVTPLALLAAVVLLYMENPWFFPAEGSTERAVATVLFWALTIVGPLPYVRGSQVARRGGGRGRGPGLHTLPVRKYPRRPVLGTDPDLHRLRVAHCRVGEADRLRLGRRRLCATGNTPSRFRRLRRGHRSPSSGTAASSSSSSTTTRRAGSPGSSPSVRSPLGWACCSAS
jgi:hypothetical protein